MRWDSSTDLAPNARARSLSLETSPGQASPNARARANNTGRVASETTVPTSRTTFRHASTMSTPDAKIASISSSRSNRSSPRAISRAAGAFKRSTHFPPRHQSGDSGLPGGDFGPSERSACRLSSYTAHRDSRNHKFVSGPERRRERRRVEIRKHSLRLVYLADQEQGDGSRDSVHAPRSTGRRGFRALPVPREAPSEASPSRARLARFRLPRLCTSLVPRILLG